MSISIQCPDCGQSVACETGTVAIGSFLICGACGHSFACRGRELRDALNNIEMRLQEIPHPLECSQSEHRCRLNSRSTSSNLADDRFTDPAHRLVTRIHHKTLVHARETGCEKD